MACSKLSKITEQHEKTLSFLHKRLMEMEFNFQELFNDNVWEFLQKKAASLSTSVGYLVPCILTSTAFVASTGSLISHKQHEIPFNLYFIFVGPPSTGKSQALKEGASLPMSSLIESEDIPNFLLDKATSSGLAKTVADNGKGFVVSPEVFDLLNKLLKSDDENATGDAQLLCELFSGERVSYRYASEKTREIGCNVPFSIFGATQVPFAARLITRMDQGHGLLDRFLFIFPTCLRPSLQDTEDALSWLESQTLKSLMDVFLEMFEYHGQRKIVYKFTESAQSLLNDLQSQEIHDINEAIKEGNPPPKCKRMDLIKRLAGSLHIFNHIASKLLEGIQPGPPPQRITEHSVAAAEKLTAFADSQKQIATEFINGIVNACIDKETKQPSLDEIKAAVIFFPGPVVTYRGFKQSAPRAVRTTAEQEFATACSRLSTYGSLVSVRVPRQTKPTKVFLKATPEEIQWNPDTLQICNREDYEAKWSLPLHSSVGNAIKNALVRAGHVTNDFLSI